MCGPAHLSDVIPGRDSRDAFSEPTYGFLGMTRGRSMFATERLLKRLQETAETNGVSMLIEDGILRAVVVLA